MKLHCKKCNKELSGNRRKYCSHNCAINDRPRVCQNCKKPYSAHQMKIYCSRKCKLEFNINNPRPLRTKSYGLGSNKIGMDIYKDEEFGWVRNVYDSKVCGFCKKEKSYKDFRKLKRHGVAYKEGKGFCGRDKVLHFSNCFECEKYKAEKRYEVNMIPQMLSNAKIRARKKNIPFNLTTKYLREIWPKDMMCPVLKVKLVMGYKKKLSMSKNYAPSLDRIVPSKGYIEGNVVIVSDLVNRMKQDASIEELEKIFKFFSNYKDNIKKIT